MELEISKITERGQVTIPQEFREELKLKKGEKILFVKQGNKLVLEPMKSIGKKVVEKLAEDLEFAKRTEEALKSYDRGEFISQDADEFLRDLEKWAKEE